MWLSKVVDVIHTNRANVPKAELQTKIAQLYKVQDPKTVFLYGFKTQFGGGRSTGFALIYDNIKVAQKYEPKYRLVRVSFQFFFSQKCSSSSIFQYEITSISARTLDCYTSCKKAKKGKKEQSQEGQRNKEGKSCCNCRKESLKSNCPFNFQSEKEAKEGNLLYLFIFFCFVASW